jgi:putative heme-binding domain-containing protein
MLLSGWIVCLAVGGAHAQEAQWIWAPEHPRDNVPVGACHFRKMVNLLEPDVGRIQIAADDAYDLYVNGRLVGRGETAKKLDEYDVSGFLKAGTNTIAVKVVNQRGRTAGLVARVMIKDGDKQWRTFSTDNSWRTNLRPLPLWNSPLYNDRRWGFAQSFGRLGDTSPWDLAENVASDERERSERFNVPEDFEVRRIIDEDKTGSLIAFTFNEFGQIIASRENGPLLLFHDERGRREWSLSRVYCDKVTNCQGILALNGDVYVTGEGPEGAGLYRLSDRNRDGTLEFVKLLLKFQGTSVEHGAHGITFGPDGWIYVILGNHSALDGDYSPNSPHRDFYEGDLVGPRYEDPSGHARGILAPGGVVFRTDLEGERVELVCGGIRNAYDLAFNREGELFFHDSDMESDEGTPWHRPTQVYHVVPGGEYGWRSGWAKWPTYFIDSLPPVMETGRGSPTGAVVYDHFAFPKRYHNTLFLADWSLGRILSVQLRPNGASFTASSEVFIEGSPLNVTDLEVGPDGGLYFITGGRGTGGGVYRVTWKGRIPEAVSNLGEGISAAIRQPQLQTAWARQEIATIQEDLGSDWERQVSGVARSTANPPHYRLRALDLMQLFGPHPSAELLVTLAGDKSELVRAKVADLMGQHPGEGTHEALIELLQDSDRLVRRKAAEALGRARQPVPAASLVPLLASDDRHEAWAARRLLEQLPLEDWSTEILESRQHRVFIQGALALLVAHPSEDHTRLVLGRVSELMREFVSDNDFIDMLRVVQVALHRSPVDTDELVDLREQLGEEFPAGNQRMNRELVRLLAYLRVSSPLDRYFQYLDAEVPTVDKLHLAIHLRYMAAELSLERKLRLLHFYEEAQQLEGGGSYPHYIRMVARDFAKELPLEQSLVVLQRGDEWPSAALGALYTLPAQLDATSLEYLTALDARLSQQESTETTRPLQVGIIAVLARSGDEESQEQLRAIWERDPERRPAVAMGLAQSPDGENWSYLVRSLAVLEGPAAREVLQRLLDVPKAPAEPEYLRQVILCGHRLGEQGAQDALSLLEYWTGELPAPPDSQLDVQLEAWTAWFGEEYPELPEARLPEEPEDSKWQLAELLEFLQGDGAAQAVSREGAEVFAKAQCSKCHRMGNVGERLGPDLTTLSKRFTRKEALESILFPSHVISDQYATKIVTTADGKTYSGMVADSGAGAITILQSDGSKVDVARDDIEEMLPSRVSAMPAGLLDPLTQEEIADLFAFLGYTAPPTVARGTQDQESPAGSRRVR